MQIFFNKKKISFAFCGFVLKNNRIYIILLRSDLILEKKSQPKCLRKSAQMFEKVSPNIRESQPKYLGKPAQIFGEASPNLGKQAQIWGAAAPIDHREWSRRFSRVRRPIKNLIKLDKKKSSWSWKDKTVLRSFTEFYKVLQSFTEFYEVLSL